MEETPARPATQGMSPGQIAFLIIGSALIAFGILSILSIGVFILPIGLTMIIGIGLWSRLWIVAALVSGIAALSIGYLGTAPLTCFGSQSVSVGAGPTVRTHEVGCTRLFLPDLERDSQPQDRELAFRIAAVSASIAGITAGLTAFAISRRRARVRRA